MPAYALTLTLFLAAAPAAEAPRRLRLAEAVDLARQTQPTLRQARADTAASAGRAEQARAGALPQITGNAAYQRTTGNYAPRPGNNPVTQAPPTSSRMYDYYTLNATATQLVFDFGQTWQRWRAARANEDAVRAAERTSERDVVLGVRRAFFVARANRELVNVAEQTVRNEERHLEQIQGFVRAGLRPEIDLASVRTDLANARVQLVSAQNGYEVARAQLAQAIGTPFESAIEPADDDLPAVPGEDGTPERLAETAAARRPELVTLEKQRYAQTLTIKSIQGAYGPALSVSGTASDNGYSWSKLVPNWGFGVTLTWPILQGGLTTGQLHEARAVLAGLDAQADAVRLQVRTEVAQAALDVRAAKASLGAAGEAQAAAADLLRLAEGRYRAGLGNVIELGDAQLAFTNAAAQAVRARYDLATARAELYAATGEP